jgi:hypothetical protein
LIAHHSKNPSTGPLSLNAVADLHARDVDAVVNFHSFLISKHLISDGLSPTQANADNVIWPVEDFLEPYATGHKMA